MTGVGQQGEGVGYDAIEGFSNDVSEVQGDADGERFAEIGGGVLVSAYTVAVSVMIVAAMVVIVVVRHRPYPKQYGRQVCYVISSSEHLFRYMIYEHNDQPVNHR